MLVVGLAHSVDPEGKFDGDDRFVRYGVAVKGIWCGQPAGSEEPKGVTHGLKDVSIGIPVCLTTLPVDRVFVGSKVL